SHRFAEQADRVPLLHGFFAGFGKTEIDCASPILIDAVVTIGREEFLGARDSELVVEVRRHGVLATLAASEGQERGADSGAASFVSEHAAVFIVRVGGDHEEAGAGLDRVEPAGEAGSAAIDLSGEIVGRWGALGVEERDENGEEKYTAETQRRGEKP